MSKFSDKHFKKFCKKEGLVLEFWVNDEVGGIAFMADMFFNGSDIVIYLMINPFNG